MHLTDQQLMVSESPLTSSIFLQGPAGTGKTTAGVNRLIYLLQEGVLGRSILLFFPQRNLGERYQKSIVGYHSNGISLPTSATFGGFARRMLGLFWPAVLNEFPQLQHGLRPTFLTLESSLYFLSKIVEPLIENEGYFSTVIIQRNRLFSQILDNLNKSAVHGFPHTEIADRLASSWVGDPAQIIIYQQAQQAANDFREYCYRNNLLDYSLQIELFNRALDQIPLLQSHLCDQFKHLIYDNCEEDISVAHDLIKQLIPHLDSHLLIFDHGAGYRNFLGASPESASDLASYCGDLIDFQASFITSPALAYLNAQLSQEITKVPSQLNETPQSLESAFSLDYQPSYPAMTDWVASKIQSLIDDGVPPGEIVILAPYLSDSLRFLLLKSLAAHSISAVSHRPSRALRDEPVTQALLTAAALAHPPWDIIPSLYEIALAFVHLFQGLDLSRAFILARQATKQSPSSLVRLADFDNIPQEFQERITFYIGDMYQQFVNWMNNYASNATLPLDHFLTHLFGELLSRPGYGFYNDLPKGRIASQIIESVQKFRLSTEIALSLDQLLVGKEYFRMVKAGVLANQYIKLWTDRPESMVYISPAYTFLLQNIPVDYQFWLDIGSRGWYERIYQPLTNPHILHRNWPPAKPWTDEEEQSHNSTSLDCLTTGLVRRCRRSIFFCLTDTNERGFEQKGTLLLALNKIIAKNSSPATLEGPLND